MLTLLQQLTRLHNINQARATQQLICRNLVQARCESANVLSFLPKQWLVKQFNILTFLKMIITLIKIIWTYNVFCRPLRVSLLIPSNFIDFNMHATMISLEVRVYISNIDYRKLVPSAAAKTGCAAYVINKYIIYFLQSSTLLCIRSIGDSRLAVCYFFIRNLRVLSLLLCH